MIDEGKKTRRQEAAFPLSGASGNTTHGQKRHVALQTKNDDRDNHLVAIASWQFPDFFSFSFFFFFFFFFFPPHGDYCSGFELSPRYERPILRGR